MPADPQTTIMHEWAKITGFDGEHCTKCGAKQDGKQRFVCLGNIAPQSAVRDANAVQS